MGPVRSKVRIKVILHVLVAATFLTTVFIFLAADGLTYFTQTWECRENVCLAAVTSPLWTQPVENIFEDLSFIIQVSRGERVLDERFLPIYLRIIRSPELATQKSGVHVIEKPVEIKCLPIIKRCMITLFHDGVSKDRVFTGWLMANEFAHMLMYPIDLQDSKKHGQKWRALCRQLTLAFTRNYLEKEGIVWTSVAGKTQYFTVFCDHHGT